MSMTLADIEKGIESLSAERAQLLASIRSAAMLADHVDVESFMHGVSDVITDAYHPHISPLLADRDALINRSLERQRQAEASAANEARL